jgi:hypothetical protein
VSGAYRGRLNVHLEICETEPAAVLVTISPDRYYPVGVADRLADLTERWNAGNPPAEAVVHGSSDPSLIGVVAHSRIRTSEQPALAEQLQAAVAAAAELFGQVAELPAARSVLRDAG